MNPTYYSIPYITPRNPKVPFNFPLSQYNLYIAPIEATPAVERLVAQNGLTGVSFLDFLMLGLRIHVPGFRVLGLGRLGCGSGPFRIWGSGVFYFYFCGGGRGLMKESCM